MTNQQIRETANKIRVEFKKIGVDYVKFIARLIHERYPGKYTDIEIDYRVRLRRVNGRDTLINHDEKFIIRALKILEDTQNI